MRRNSRKRYILHASDQKQVFSLWEKVLHIGGFTNITARTMIIYIFRAEYSLQRLRYISLAITTLCLVLSIIMMVIGFFVYDRYHAFADFYGDATSGGILTPALFTIVLGVLLLLATVLGFVGIFKESTCLVNSYAIVLAILVILKLVVVILAFTVNIISVESSLNIPIAQYVTDTKIENKIDSLQVTLNCCGSKSYKNYEGLEFTSKHSTTIFPATIFDRQIVVPSSCCITEESHVCVNERTNGCKFALVNLYMDNSYAISVLGLVAVFLKVAGVMFALLLARRIRRAKSERGLRSWTIRERVIVARQNQNQPEVQPTHQDATAANEYGGDPPPYSASN